MAYLIKYFSQIISCFCQWLLILLLMPSLSIADDSSNNINIKNMQTNAAGTAKLEDLIQEALERNPMLQANKHEVESKRSEIGPKGSYDDPMLELEAMDYPAKRPFKREAGMTSYKIGLSQKVPFPGKLSKMKETSTFEAISKEEMYNQEKLKLVKEVKHQYHELFLLYKKKNILNEELNLIRQIISVTRNQYTLGNIPQAELINFQVEEATILEQITMVEKQISVKIGDLNHSLGKEEHHHFGKIEELKDVSIEFNKLNKQEIQQQVLAQSPSLKVVSNEISASESNLSYAKKGYLPDFEFKVSYTFNDSLSPDTEKDSVSGMIGLSLPLWFAHKQSEQVKGAVAMHAYSRNKYEEERIHLIHMVHTVYSELEEANKRLKLYQGGLLPLTRQAVLTGKSAYLTGKIPYSTLLNFIKTRFQTEFAYFESLVQYENGLAELEALLGKPIKG